MKMQRAKQNDCFAIMNITTNFFICWRANTVQDLLSTIVFNYSVQKNFFLFKLEEQKWKRKFENIKFILKFGLYNCQAKA